MHLGAKTGFDGPVAPLMLKREMCETDENLARNIERTLSRPYVRFNEFMDSQSGPVSVCGSGPSFARTYPNLIGDVMACNGSHDYLIERGITPKYCMVMDAAPYIDDFITPNDRVLYFLASRCHENIYSKLEKNKVVTWHCKGEDCIDEILARRGIMEPMVHGGSGAAIRALFIVIAMGYKEVHIHGADSSYEDDLHHVGKVLAPETTLEVWSGKWFKTTAWMAGQVEDFRDCALKLRDLGVTIIVHGEGLLPSMAHALGLEVRPSIT